MDLNILAAQFAALTPDQRQEMLNEAMRLKKVVTCKTCEGPGLRFVAHPTAANKELSPVHIGLCTDCLESLSIPSTARVRKAKADA